jgi:phosphoserine phosphatase
MKGAKHGKRETKYKLVCFDVDGTLVDEVFSVWRMVHKVMGIDQGKLDRASEQYFSGKMTFREWADHDIALWKERGVTKEDMETIVSKFSVMPGAREVVDALRARGMKLAVISGGIDIVLYHFFPDAEKLFSHIVINRLAYNADGTIRDCIVPPQFDHGDHKAKVLRDLAKKEGINPSEVIFVGDAHNDIDALKAAGLGIAFNASEEVKKAANVVIEGKDLRGILRHIV